MDSDIVDGIELWLKARMVGAIHTNDKVMFECVHILLNDVTSCRKNNEYPWEMLMRGFTDTAKKRMENFKPPVKDDDNGD